VNTERPEWHVAEADLVGYAVGTTPLVPAASIETHLLGCARCRAVLAEASTSQREQAWARLADTVDRPSPSLLERLTGRQGMLRSAVATPVLVRAALVAIALVGLVPLVAAVFVENAAPVALLVLAPLAPVAAVALAYRDQADPAGEISLALPQAGLRLVAVRAVVVALGALVLGVGGLLLIDLRFDVPTGLAFAWCLPGLALASLVLLAGTTRIDPLPVAVGLSLGWAAALTAGATVRRSFRPDVLLDVIASPAFQSAALLVALAALALTVVRRDDVAYRRIR